MSMEIKDRPLPELEAMVMPILRLQEELRSELINIAENNNQSQTKNLAVQFLIDHGYALKAAEENAALVRVLAIIKRDHGENEFNRIVAKQF